MVPILEPGMLAASIFTETGRLIHLLIPRQELLDLE